MIIEDSSYRHDPFSELEDATSTCARAVHDELTRRYAVPVARFPPTAQTRSHWTNWEAYRFVPSEDDLQPVPLVGGAPLLVAGTIEETAATILAG